MKRHRLPKPDAYTEAEDRAILTVNKLAPQHRRPVIEAFIADGTLKGRSVTGALTRLGKLRRRMQGLPDRSSVRRFSADEDAAILRLGRGGHFDVLTRQLGGDEDTLRRRYIFLKACAGEPVQRNRHSGTLALPVAGPTWMKPLTREQLMAGR